MILFVPGYDPATRANLAVACDLVEAGDVALLAGRATREEPGISHFRNRMAPLPAADVINPMAVASWLTAASERVEGVRPHQGHGKYSHRYVRRVLIRALFVTLDALAPRGWNASVAEDAPPAEGAQRCPAAYFRVERPLRPRSRHAPAPVTQWQALVGSPPASDCEPSPGSRPRGTVTKILATPNT